MNLEEAKECLQGNEKRLSRMAGEIGIGGTMEFTSEAKMIKKIRDLESLVEETFKHNNFMEKVHETEIGALKREVRELKMKIQSQPKAQPATKMVTTLRPREQQISQSDIYLIKQYIRAGYSYSQIQKLTKWSKATISRVKNGHYD